MKIKDIRLECLKNIRDAECFIKNYIDDGWKLLGPLSLSSHPMLGEFAVLITMVKYEEETIEDKTKFIVDKYDYKQTINNISKIIDDIPGVIITHKDEYVHTNALIEAMYKIKQEIKSLS